MSILKRQRELKKSEKAASKRMKKHGTVEEGFTEPQPTFRLSDLGRKNDEDEGDDKDTSEDDTDETEREGEA
ncbi:MAG: hypothetical protein OEV00_05670 [Acidobacteriota bacterium]|nr:hypothetical protein [Acidobacteriota bacterium]